MEEIFSLNNNLLINNDVSLNGNLNVKNINTIDLSVNNILKTKHLDVYGNLTVYGTQTIINSEVLNVDDNIIIVNADGEFIQQAGLQANIEGNLYGLLYDTNINAWTINDKNLHLNKLVGNNIELTNNVNASWFNGNLSGTNAILRENVTASWFNGNLSGTNANLSNNVTASWFNGNLSGTNAILRENVTASWFNGNLSGTNASLSNNVTASWFNGNLSGTNASLLNNVTASWFNGNLSGTNASLSNNVTAQWFNGNLSGTNAILRENVTAPWFNGNLSGTNATLTENVRASWFNGNLSGTNANLSNNVNASWFNGNLSGTNAILRENVTAQWFNGNLSGTNAILRETLKANTIHVNELHLGSNTLYIDNKPILYTHNGNLLMNVDHFHGDLIGNLISKNTFVNGNIIIGNNFGIKFNDGTTITSGNVSLLSGGGGTSNVTPEEIDDRISNYLFNKPEPPTDSSHNFQIITSNDRTHPTISLQWSNPTSKRVAFIFGNTQGYDDPKNHSPLPENRSNFNSNKNITHLPYSRELKIQFREENHPHNWANLTLHSDGTTSSDYIIPNTVITANINSSGNPPTLIANTVSNTYTEFKSGKGIQIGNKYQFRIYLINEITKEDSSYNYLYIPSETEYIAFGGFANVTQPTEILFPENNFNNLQIKGTNANTYVETAMNTTFPIPENYDLRVRYGFDIHTSDRGSKQMPNARGNIISGKFITGNLRNNNFIENISSTNSLTLIDGNNVNWYPQYDYHISNFFMEANLDIEGNIAQTTIGNTIRTPLPTRNEVNAATKFLGNLSKRDFTNDLSGVIFTDLSNSSISISGKNIYSYQNDDIFNNIFILDSNQSFDLKFNPNIEKLINNTQDFTGIHSIDVSLCQFKGNTIIENLEYYYRIEPPLTTPNVTTYKLVYTSYEESKGILFNTKYMYNWYGTGAMTSRESYDIADRAENFVKEVIDPIIVNGGNIDIYYRNHSPQQSNVANDDYYPYFAGAYEEYGSPLKKKIDGVFAWPGYDGIQHPRRKGSRSINYNDFRYFAIKDDADLHLLGYRLYNPMLYRSTNFSKGFLEVTDLSTQPVDINYVNSINSGFIINANVDDNAVIQGYYTDVNLFEIGVRNINLEKYPDIALNSYNFYKTSISQIVSDYVSFVGIQYDNVVGEIYFNFGVAEKSALDIQGIHDLTRPEVTLDNNFFGLKRPNNSTQIDINYTLSLININQLWRSNLNIINNLDLTYNHTSITLDSISSTDKLWASNANININPNLSINPSNLWYNTNNNTLLYSRNFTGTHQLKIDYNINNNIGRTQTTRESSIDFGFGTQSKILWWDYTWGINNGPPSNFFSTTPSSANTSLQFINAVGNNSFSSNTTFDHGISLAYNQLMWANGGFRSGGINQSDNNNPYIDYTNFYNPSSVLSNYESKRTLGDTINYNYTPGGGRQWWNNTTLNETLSTLVKFITFNIEMPYKEDINGIGNRYIFTITINSLSHISSPTNINGFLIFHTEKNTSNITSGPYDGQAVFAIENNIGSHNGDTTNPGYLIRNTSSDISPGPKTTLQISIGISNNLDINMQQVSIGFQKIE